MNLRLTTTLLGAALLFAAPARAESLDQLRARALAAEADFNYDRAVDLWVEIIARDDVTEAQRMEANLHAGKLTRALGRDMEARIHFLYVLRRDPEYRLPKDVSPKIRNFYELVRQEVRMNAPAPSPAPASPSVLVEGSPTQINALTQVRTEPVDITGLTESFRQQVTLALPVGITLDEVVQIFVDVEIEPFLTTRPYNRELVLQGLTEELEAVVDPDMVRVVLFGPLPALENLLDEEVRVTIDLFELEEGVYSLEPVVDFPERGIELRSIQPSQVTVNITRVITITDELTGTLPLTETTTAPTIPSVATGSRLPAASLGFAAAPHPISLRLI